MLYTRNKLLNVCALSVIVFTITLADVYAQEDLMQQLEQDIDTVDQQKEVQAVFKGTRVILGHSTKTKSKNALEFIITHRFGRINLGPHDLWGLDNSSVRIGLEYGVTDRLNVGVGRSSFDKTFDGFLKYKPLVQKTQGMPVSMVLFTSGTIKTTPKSETDPTVSFNDRLAFAGQVLISRKITNRLSLQVAPTIISRNRLLDSAEVNQLYAIGLGGRFKITKKLTFNMEYYPRLNPYKSGVAPESQEYDSFSVGVDIETGGHVFQLHLTNSQMTFERAFVAETFDDFLAGDIHFGFNITRNFQLK